MPEPTEPTPGDAPTQSPPGRKATYIDQRQADDLIAQVAQGKGVEQALFQMGIPYRAYRNTARKDTKFRAELQCARRAADQALEEVAYLRAQTDGGIELLIKLLERRDRAKLLDLARGDRAKERAEDFEERRLDRALKLHLVEMEAMARAKERALPIEDDAQPDYSRLTDAELAQMRSLMDKVVGIMDSTPHPPHSPAEVRALALPYRS